jgi:predicted ribosome quality control (RQC) complex YloA/Tae2 family protein
MEIELQATSSWKNLQNLYDKLKELKEKEQKISKEIQKTTQEIEKIKQSQKTSEQQATVIRQKTKTKWFEQYCWFFTSNNLLVVSGKNAKQNDELVSKHLKENDLFFHADIYGASTTILKNSNNANEQDIKEAAQWAACFSSAWKRKMSNIDVFYVNKNQVSKHMDGAYVGRGAFVINGKRNWLKNIRLGLRILYFEQENYLKLVPLDYPINSSNKKIKINLEIYPGDSDKEIFVKEIEKKFKDLKIKIDSQELLKRLPSGGFFSK